MLLKKILPLPYQRILSRKDLERSVSGVALDSRQVKDDFVFFAMPGYDRHGYDFVGDAIAAGAKIIVSDREPKPDVPKSVLWLQSLEVRQLFDQVVLKYFQHPSKAVQVMGVTGTNGKSTVTHLIEHLFNTSHRPCALVGTLEHRFKNQKWSSKNTTPDPLLIQSLLAEMRRAGAKYCAMEVSSHGLAQKRVSAVDFAAAVFTNLSRDHLDFHGSMESYFQAKRSLFQNLNHQTPAIINMDCEYGRRLIKEMPNQAVSFSLKETVAQYCLLKSRYESGMTVFEIAAEGEIFQLKTNLIGRHNLQNILAAIALVRAFQVPWTDIRDALRIFRPVKGRMEMVPNDKGIQIIVDYAHTPDALMSTLQSLKEINQGRIITVFGCGGDRDRNKRSMMGEIAERYSDRVIITNDNPRTEEPQHIVNDIVKKMNKNSYQICLDRSDAIRTVIQSARPDDTVLIAGKGHEDYQIIGSTIHAFNDRTIAESHLCGS